MALAPATVSPAPLASAPDVALAATVIFKSSTFSVSVLSVVVFPSTNKFPVTVTFPATFKFAPTPRPPVTTTAPVEALSLCVLLVNVVAPLAVKVVNAAVDGVLFPIGELFTKMAIPVVNFLTRMVEAFNRLPDGTKNFLALATVIIDVPR